MRVSKGLSLADIVREGILRLNDHPDHDRQIDRDEAHALACQIVLEIHVESQAAFREARDNADR